MDLFNEQPPNKEKQDPLFHDKSMISQEKEKMNHTTDQLNLFSVDQVLAEEQSLQDSFTFESEELLAVEIVEPQLDHLGEAIEQAPKERKEGRNEQLDKLMKELAQQPDIESKLKLAITFMEASLAQNGAPNFRTFWELRKTCLETIRRKSIQPAARYSLWSKYIELSKEARRLKEILDEQSAFAAEQIDIAIQALEQDIAQLPESMAKAGPVEFPSSLEVF